MNLLPMPLRVLVQTRDFPPQSGGIAQVAYRLAEALTGGGHEVEVHAGEIPGGAEPARGGPELFPVRRLHKRALRRALDDYLAQGRPDLVIAVHWKAARDTVARCRSEGIPLFVVVHGKEVSERRGWLRRLRLRRVLARADRIVCVSRFTARTVAEGFDIASARIAVIHPGVDTERYHPAEPSPDLRERYGLGAGPILLTVGRLVERKGHDMVIRALPRIRERHPEARYVVCGGGAEADLDRLRRLARSEGVADATVFAGHVPEEDVAELYRSCAVCVMPSRILPGGDSEGFGITYLEAGACARPVVGGRQAGVVDAIVHGETGLLVDPQDPGAIADAVVRLLDDPDLARRMGEGGRARVLAEFTWSSIARRYLALLEDVRGGAA